MDHVDHHPLVDETSRILGGGLNPTVSHVFAGVLPTGIEWPEVLRAKDDLNGRRGGEYQSRDVALLLRVVTVKLGRLGRPYTYRVPRQAGNHARELRSVRNQWAHNGEFSAAEAFRAVDSAELILSAVGATDAAQVGVDGNWGPDDRLIVKDSDVPGRRHTGKRR